MNRKEFAVTFVAHERAELLEVDPEDSPLDRDEVRGKSLASVVSAGTEINFAYRGQSFPRVPGYATVFEVEACGPDVRALRPGDRVFCLGPHRSFQRMPESKCVSIPGSLSPEVAVFARMMGVSMSTLTTAAARPPEVVTVYGAGLVGYLAAEIFGACGYEVYVYDPSPARRETAKNLCHARLLEKPPSETEAIAGKIALAIDCSGHEAAVLDACKSVKKRGEVALIGAPWKRQTEISAHDLMHTIFHRYVVLRSGWEWELPLFETEFKTNSIYGNYVAAMRWLEQGFMTVEGLYELCRPADAQKVYQDLLYHRLARLAAVFDWRLL